MKSPRKLSTSWYLPLLLAAAVGYVFSMATTLADTVSVTLPKTRQITQRNASNKADIRVTGSFNGVAARLEARAVVMPGATNNGVSTDWVVIVNAPTNGVYAGTLTNITAGGWYRVEVRAMDTSSIITVSNGVDRVGVGDILVTAGQSNAGCYGSPTQTPTDDRVSSYIVFTKSWQFGKDAQPDNSGGMGAGGSPWPALGSRLVASNQVPVGFVCLAVGGSSLASWLPGTTSFQNVSNVMRTFGTNGVRAVLWHQGETDASSVTPATNYFQMLSNVIAQSRIVAGWSVPWGIAEASYNAGNGLAGQEGVNAGQRLCAYTITNCFRGARTDDFHLEGKLSDFVHFNGVGLSEHAQMWANALLGVQDLTVKNGNFESNVALAEGGIQFQIRTVGWNRVNAAGESVSGGNGGYLNPNSNYYLNAVDSINGGVLSNMNGRHVGMLYGTTAFLPAEDAYLQTFAAQLQPSTIYTLQAAVGVRNGNFHGGYRFDFLTNGVTYGNFVTGNVATLNALAGGDATNKFTVVSCVVTSAVPVSPGQQLAIRISKPSGGGTYLDFDDVRLTTQLTPYGQWQMTNWNSLTLSNSFPEADPDGDGLPNLIEYQLGGANPLVPTTMPQPLLIQLSGEDYWQMQLLKSPTGSGAIEVQLSYDMSSWFTPVNSGNGDVIVVSDATQFTVKVRRSVTPKAFFRIAAKT